MFICYAVLCLVFYSCPTLCDSMEHSLPGSSVYGDSTSKEYWSGLPCLPPADLPNKISNPGLLHCRQILYQLSYQGSPPVLIVFFKSHLIVFSSFFIAFCKCLYNQWTFLHLFNGIFLLCQVMKHRIHNIYTNMISYLFPSWQLSS